MAATTPMPPSEVRTCLDRWFKTAPARHRAADLMAEALDRFGSHSEAWAVLAIRSQYDGLQRLQLMVGNVIVMSLRQDGATIVYFDKGEVGRLERVVQDHPGVSLEYGPFRLPCLVIPEADLLAVLDSTLTAARRHLEDRAPKPRAKRTQRASSHSHPAIAELSRVVGRPVTEPAYA